MSSSPRAATFVVLLCCACGGTTSATSSNPDASNPFDAGGVDSSTTDSGVPTAKPRAIVRTMGGAAAGCITVPPFAVGDFGDPSNGNPAKPVDDGGDEGGKSVAITCRVAPSAGGGYDLEGSIAIAGDASFTIKATLDSAGKTTAADFTLAKTTTTWSSMTCNLDPSSLAPGQGGVAAGRFWSRLSCIGSTSNNGATCDIFGELRLENCAQK